MDAARALQNGHEPVEPWQPEAYALRLPRRIDVPRSAPLAEVVESLLAGAPHEVPALVRNR
jgi:hypothetical protein